MPGQRRVCLLALIGLVPVILLAEDRPSQPPVSIDAAGLFEKVRPSVVVISVGDRTGRYAGVGTGFVISRDGLIATNRHVIGESRDLTVTPAEGPPLAVQAIHAVSKEDDLAIIRVDAQNLTPIELGMSAKVAAGDPVLAVGNPQGLQHSVVAGIVSAKREIDGMPMLQLALPVEPGNSGGPVIDRLGRVVGIVTMKSAVTENLGFAIESDRLGELIARPNPIPMEQWRTIGALDSTKWRIVFGSDWRQRAGQILVRQPGASFGGRSLCLAVADPPPIPYEVAVSVKIDDDSGAAGLVFASDGQDCHYGFYPSGGGLRLTCFRGPDINSWRILSQITTPAYQAGQWNELKVRVEKDRVLGFVNDQKVIESDDLSFRAGKVGLAKFRDTSASFRRFACATTLPAGPGPDELARLDQALEGSRPGQIDPLLTQHPEQAAQRIERKARRLEEQARELRQLRDRVAEQSILDGLSTQMQKKEEEIELVESALLLAKLENHDLDVAAYREEVDAMARQVQIQRAGSTPAETMAALDRFFFVEKGFHGSRAEYYHRSNSYLNEVIDDREGLPITLAVLYLALAERLALPVSGVGLPGHFIVCWNKTPTEVEYIDVFDRGRRLSLEDVQLIIRTGSDEPADVDRYRANKKEIILRMLSNILRASQEERHLPAMKRALSAFLAVEPDRIRERWQRGVLALETNDFDQAERDARWLLERQPEGVDLEAVHQMLDWATRRTQEPTE
jgi:regulator of sirC expression with transglutaminase-like and TPR domain